jgi:hypothetical protein
MNSDFRFALYVFCMDFHSGQWSRLYRLGSRIGASLRDNHIYAIQGNRHKRKENNISQACWDEWETARKYYRELKRSKYAKETK